MHHDNDTRAPVTRRGRLRRPPPQRRPLTQEERAAAENILRRPLWPGTLERAVAAAVLRFGEVTERQSTLLLAVGERLAQAEAEAEAGRAAQKRPARVLSGV
jgi:hypothetical protein